MTFTANYPISGVGDGENKVLRLTLSRPPLSWTMNTNVKQLQIQSRRALENNVQLPANAAGEIRKKPQAQIDQGPSDGELVRQTIGGNRKAFDQLIRRYERQALNVAYRLLGHSHDALEIAQDSFLNAYARLKQLQKPEAFGGWLMRIVANLSLNARRARQTRRQLQLDNMLAGDEKNGRCLGHQLDAVHRLNGRELGERLQVALERLPEKQRLALLMFTVDEMPQKQIAAALKCSVDAVKWHVFNGRRRLRKLLEDVL